MFKDLKAGNYINFASEVQYIIYVGREVEGLGAKGVLSEGDRFAVGFVAHDRGRNRTQQSRSVPSSAAEVNHVLSSARFKRNLVAVLVTRRESRLSLARDVTFSGEFKFGGHVGRLDREERHSHRSGGCDIQ